MALAWGTCPPSGEPLGTMHVVCHEAVGVEGHPTLAAGVDCLGVLLAHQVAHPAVPAHPLPLHIPLSGDYPVPNLVIPVNS